MVVGGRPIRSCPPGLVGVERQLALGYYLRGGDGQRDGELAGVSSLQVSSEDVYRLVVGAAALMGGVIVFGLIVWYCRRSMNQRGTSRGWTLEELTQLHSAGQLTDQEFEQLRGQLVGLAQHRGQRAAPANETDD
jgi:hypothetical protein